MVRANSLMHCTGRYMQLHRIKGFFCYYCLRFINANTLCFLLSCFANINRLSSYIVASIYAFSIRIKTHRSRTPSLMVMYVREKYRGKSFHPFSHATERGQVLFHEIRYLEISESRTTIIILWRAPRGIKTLKPLHSMEF